MSGGGKPRSGLMGFQIPSEANQGTISINSANKT